MIWRPTLIAVAVVFVSAGAAAAQPKPDLTCAIYASALKDFSSLIADGAKVSFGGGGPRIWFAIRLNNTGQAPTAANFVANILIKRNGATVFNKGYPVTPPIAPGAWKFRPLDPESISVTLPGTTNVFDVTGYADAQNAIGESSEGNNQCTLHFTVTVVG